MSTQDSDRWTIKALEEGNEVGQAVAKVNQFGALTYPPNSIVPNYQQVEDEIKQLLLCVDQVLKHNSYCSPLLDALLEVIPPMEREQILEKINTYHGVYVI